MISRRCCTTDDEIPACCQQGSWRRPGRAVLPGGFWVGVVDCASRAGIELGVSRTRIIASRLERSMGTPGYFLPLKPRSLLKSRYFRPCIAIKSVLNGYIQDAWQPSPRTAITLLDRKREQSACKCHVRNNNPTGSNRKTVHGSNRVVIVECAALLDAFTTLNVLNHLRTCSFSCDTKFSTLGKPRANGFCSASDAYWGSRSAEKHSRLFRDPEIF